MRFIKIISLFLITGSLIFADSSATDGPVKVEMSVEEESIQAGQPFWVAVRFHLQPTWHTYWKNPGDAGMPIDIKWDLPEGFVVDDVKWPAPKHFTSSGLTGIGYEDEVTLLAKVTPPKTLNSEQVAIKANVKWVTCSDECVPGSAQLSFDVPVGLEQPKKLDDKMALFTKARLLVPGKPQTFQATSNEHELSVKLPFAPGSLKNATFYAEEIGLMDLSKNQTLESDDQGYTLKAALLKSVENESVKGVIKTEFSHASENAAIDVVLPINHETSSSALWWALLAAFGGGVILNLMPCVLPVLSLKVLSVVESAGGSFRERLRQSMAYFVGVVLSFWALTALLLAFRASGREMGWGFQLQEPIFVGILAALMFLMALNFFGVFEFGTKFSALDGGKPKKSPLMGALWSGVLATIVATPCTGPFLGASLGFAMTLPPIGTFGLFTVMAIGMALPFFLLTLFPTFLRLLPKPGQWMIVLKQGMGFILAASVLWLVWVWEAQTGFTAVMWLLVSFLVLSIGAWIYGQWGQPIVRPLIRRTAMVAMLASIAVSVVLITKAAKDPEISEGGMIRTSSVKTIDVSWEHFTKERFEELKTQGKPVFIDFTAKWCLLCQANKVILHSDPVEDALKKAGITPLKADWTRGDAEITKMLKELGRTGVPLYVFYVPGKAPIILSETLTQEMMIEAIENVH